MTSDEAVQAVIDALDHVGIAYMIVGSLASNFHGIPRSTRDADFVIDLGPGELARLASQLPDALILDAQGAFEAVTGTTRYVIRLVAHPFVCELFVRSDDPHDIERFRRRARVQALGRRIEIATAEDMIVTKLRWIQTADRGKDRDDVRNIIAVRGAELDWPYIGRWTAVHRTSVLLDAIRASVPPA